MQSHASHNSPVFDLLRADGPLDDAHVLYAPLIGSWDVELTTYDTDGSVTETVAGEWHFGWVLGGRGVQDVLYAAGAPAEERGTTLRVRDAERDVWHVVYMQPHTGEFFVLSARADGDDIVQEGDGPDGPEVWTFSDIRPATFTWRCEIDGVLRQWMAAKRQS